MILTLEVIGEQAQDLGTDSRKVFNAIGGTIGRLPDNDWVFPDPYVSGRHALIRYLNGKYFIEDTSTNGVFVNTPDYRISRTEAHQLHDGDVVYIDAYQIKVSIARDPEAAKRNDPFAQLQARHNARGTREIPPPAPEEDRTASMVKRPAASQNEDHPTGTQWFGIGEMADEHPVAAPRERAKAEPRRPPPASARVRRPHAAAPARPAPSAPPPRSAPSSAEQAELLALLNAAGIEGLDPSSAAAQTLGEMLRAAVSGLMEVLRGRERMKDELRVRGTTFKVANNNPLKFSANVDDAFHNLLVKRNQAYLEPTEALEDAFRDVRDHQAAFLSAMRLAFESMLAQLDPSRLQEDFDRQLKKGAIIGVPAKLRYWDLYRDKYSDLAKDAQGAFRTLFGDAFAKAYEEQLERLQGLARGRDK
ncbi:MAG TPA: type VI secretion system-associated FHA domain protein TagH [Steroidobacteraceae bacterium]|nr:type VI secretion system-associated FHA domain protein TagH [Steroidobacteraceae bacterium]